jgi:hypothetical protein
MEWVSIYIYKKEPVTIKGHTPLSILVLFLVVPYLYRCNMFMQIPSKACLRMY